MPKKGTHKDVPPPDDEYVTTGHRVPRHVAEEFSAHAKRHGRVAGDAAAAAFRVFIRLPLALQAAAMDRQASEAFWKAFEQGCKSVKLE